MTINVPKEAITVEPATDRWPSRLRIPVGSSLQMLYEHAACPPILQRTLCKSVSWQQRLEITVNQALLSPNLAPAWIAALLVVDVCVFYGDEGAKQAPLSELMGGQGLHGRRLLSLTIPLDTGRLRWGEAHIARMPGDWPIITAVAAVEVYEGAVHGARLALSGVWHESARLAEAAALLNNHPLDDEHVELVARAAASEVGPAGDFLASVAYRRAMAVALTRRVLHQCQAMREGESN